MSKLNCWEHKRCGREPTGVHGADFGPCPAALEKKLDGVHGGVNAGRACWVVAGTYCDGRVQGTFARKISSCDQCDFYQLVRREERDSFFALQTLLNRLHSKAWH